MTLCDKTEQDLRSCLNTLQFLAKRKKLICSTDLTGLQCGQKDISKSAFQMWQQLFLDKVCMLQPDVSLPKTIAFTVMSRPCQAFLGMETPLPVHLEQFENPGL